MSPSRGNPEAAVNAARRKAAPSSAEPQASEERRWRFVRVVYPLNPGIPHFLDFPGAGE